MEDSHFEILNFGGDSKGSLFGVFDGHGGSAVARFCKDHFPDVLKSEPAFQSPDGTLEALRSTYMKLDEMLQDPVYYNRLKRYAGDTSTSSEFPSISKTGGVRIVASPSHPAFNTGCTAVVVYVHENTLYVANTGDSRAVLCRDGEAIDLTTDHKVTLDTEVERISKAGGMVINGRVNGSLNLTRAIGDLSFKSDMSIPVEGQVISAVPDIRKFELIPETDDFIVIACDGIWEVMTSQEVVDYVSHGLRRIRGGGGEDPKSLQTASLPSSISELTGNMLDLACSDDVGRTAGIGGDNLSCIIVDLRPGKPLSNLDRVSKCSEGPFILKPSKYKAFEFRSGHSSSDSDDFGDLATCEARIEKLEDDEMVTCTSGLSPTSVRETDLEDSTSTHPK
jgi:serine/threonine protein phosphatase PrpC